MLDLLWNGLYFAPDDSGGGGEAQSDEDANQTDEVISEEAEEESPDISEESEDELAGLSAEEMKAQLLKTRKALSKANNEAKERRLALKKFEEDDAKRKKKEMTEIERLMAEKDEAEGMTAKLIDSLRSVTLRSAVTTSASELDFRAPDDAYDLADLSDAREILSKDEDLFERGKASDELLKEIKRTLANLAKSKPYLIQKVTKPDIDSRSKSNEKKPSEERIKRRFGIN